MPECRNRNHWKEVESVLLSGNHHIDNQTAAIVIKTIAATMLYDLKIFY